MVVLDTHCSIPNRTNVPPLMMKPAGKMAFTPHMERYFPTRGPDQHHVNLRISLSISPNIKRERWIIPKTAPNCEAEAPFSVASMG